MQKDTFSLRPTDEYIELMKLIKLKDIAQSGGHAKTLIDDGMVKVNGKIEFRKRNKIRKGDVIQVDGVEITIE